MIDTHAHLYFDRFDEDRGEVISRARQHGVDRIINIGIDVATSREAVALAAQYEGLYASCGLHPTSPIDDLSGDLRVIRDLATSHREHVVAIGEFGLDYYWEDVSPAEQRPRLDAQLDLASELELPVIFHCRDAIEELLAVLEARAECPPGVFHCFAGGAGHAERALALGFHISFAGNVTYPKSVPLHEAARVVPSDRLLLETDSPFLSPQPKRGRRNEPAYVRFSRDFLAELRGVPPEELEANATENSERLFDLANRTRPPRSGY